MRKKIHKTRLGKEINIDEIIARHGDVIAAGNMRVNARGDSIDSKGNVVKTAAERTKAYYKDNPKASAKVGINRALKEEELREVEEEKQKTKKKTKKKAPDEIIEMKDISDQDVGSNL